MERNLTAPTDSSSDYLTVTVVVPVHNSRELLRRCLAALEHSTYRHFDILVVDDASTDDSAELAREFGAQVARLNGNRGPAYARNRGAEAASGDILLFIDADVCVHPDTLQRVVEEFHENPDVAALMGSYDDRPEDRYFLSQYKNLFHHYVHQTGSRNASTFWSGCGAVRRHLFLQMGGFNEGYGRPCIEDIELGFRLRREGHRILLVRSVQATHLKQWAFRNLIQTEIFGRGVPWVALMARDRSVVHDLNLSWHSRVCTALAYLLVAAIGWLMLAGHWASTLPVLSFVGLGVASIVLHDRVDRKTWRELMVMSMAVVPLLVWAAGGLTQEAAPSLALLAAILAIHEDFYRFYRRTRGLCFAVGVVPMHLLFFLYSGLCIPLGIAAYFRDQHRARKWATGPGTIPAAPLGTGSSERRPVFERRVSAG